jgi:hypothetical protein
MQMDAVGTYKTLVDFYSTTRLNKPVHSHLHTRRSDNINSLAVSIPRSLSLVYVHVCDRGLCECSVFHEALTAYPIINIFQAHTVYHLHLILKEDTQELAQGRARSKQLF